MVPRAEKNTAGTGALGKSEGHDFVSAESRDTSLEESAGRGRRVYAWTLAKVGCEMRVLRMLEPLGKWWLVKINVRCAGV